MDAIIKAIGKTPSLATLPLRVEEGYLPALLTQSGGAMRALGAAILRRETDRPIFVLCTDETNAGTLAADLEALLGESVVQLTGRDLALRDIEVVSRQEEQRRLRALDALYAGAGVAVCTVSGLLQRTLPPDILENAAFTLRLGEGEGPEALEPRLLACGYRRSDMVEGPGQFSRRGGILDIFSPGAERPVRAEFWGDEIERISEINPLTGAAVHTLSHTAIYPASHYVTPPEKMARAVQEIRRECDERVKFFKDHEKPLEAERIAQRTNFDIEMIQELGYCSGVENYSRIISGRPVGSAPMTLLDYFPKDFLLFIDESHVTLPQVRAMYHGDRARKEALVEYGFRLPSAFDNRPLKFEEFQQRVNQVIYVSATPGEYERTRSGQIAEQIIRPTGLTDPKIDVRPIEGQIDDLIAEIHARIERGERTLVTTLTKRMAEDLTAYLGNAGIKTRYMHHDVGAMERMEIIRDLRRGEFDVLVGINLLREGLDLPEVSLIAILDADKEGFLRSETSLIQTIGRAARNAEGTVIMYADTVTPSMRAAIDETERRRAIQTAYNEAHGIVPKTIKKSIRDLLEITGPAAKDERGMRMTERERKAEIDRLEKEMRKAAQMLEYEYAAVLRDQIIRLRGEK